ncbi:hypothetical protein C817_00822 [Dorea sp. 5-2]|nr:hypothetical protein C817_00822 [Dorea sp. 5-2]
MNQLFNIDNPVMQFISKIFDLVILNLIFILFSIPVITMGASLCGMYYVSLKIVRGEDPYIWKNFFKAFRQNFKQGTLVWILLLLIFAFLGMDFYILNSQDTVLFAVIRVLLWVICGILFGVFLYIFPVISHFVCSTRQAFKNSVYMIVGFLPYTILMLAISGVILYLCTASSRSFALVIILSGICGHSVVAYTFCIFFDRIFRKYEPDDNTSDSGCDA